MSLRKSTHAQVIDLNKPYSCEFCKKSFAQERTLISHVCDAKHRHQQRDQPHVKLAYQAYKIMHVQLNPHKAHAIPTYMEFQNSGLYTQLVRFGAWCTEHLVQEFESWVKHLIKHNMKVHTWCDSASYDVFLKDLLLTEPAEQALCRSLYQIHDWHTNTGEPYGKFFECVHVNQLVTWIKQGRISAWLLYNCVTAEHFLNRCSPEHIQHMHDHVNPTAWKIRFMRHADQVQVIKQTLAEVGL